MDPSYQTVILISLSLFATETEITFFVGYCMKPNENMLSQGTLHKYLYVCFLFFSLIWHSQSGECQIMVVKM